METKPWSWVTWVLFVVLVLAWGFNYLFVNLGLTGSGPLWLATLRAALGLGGMAVLVTAARGWGVLDARGRRDALLLGLPNTTLFFGLWFLGATRVPPGIASVVVYTFPLWVAVLSAPMLNRSLSGAAWASVVAGFVGVALIAQFWSLVGPGVSVVPVLELLGSAGSWAVGTVLFRRRFQTREVLSASAYQVAGGTVGLVAITLLLTPSPLPRPTFDVVASVLWLGLAGTAVAYAIWFTLLDRTPAAQISAYLFLVPAVALAASAALLGERLSAVQAVGVGLVVVAIYGIARAPTSPRAARPVVAGPR